MEGYLIRVPVEACFPDSRPVWRQTSDAAGPAHSRVLYYVLEEGYLRGYETPDSPDEPVESFQLTSHRIEVNVMYSLNIFEIKARAVHLPPSHQFVENTSSSSSDSSDDDGNNTTKRGKPASSYMPQTGLPSSPEAVSGSYHVVFFAPNKELLKTWSVKLLNWNRYVFRSSHDLNEAELKLAEAEIMESLRVVNATDRFLRPIELRTAQDYTTISPPPAPVDQMTTNTLTPTETTKPISAIESANVVKPSNSPNPWWVVPFTRSKKISSYSLRR